MCATLPSIQYIAMMASCHLLVTVPNQSGTSRASSEFVWKVSSNRLASCKFEWTSLSVSFHFLLIILYKSHRNLNNKLHWKYLCWPKLMKLNMDAQLSNCFKCLCASSHFWSRSHGTIICMVYTTQTCPLTKIIWFFCEYYISLIVLLNSSS